MSAENARRLAHELTMEYIRNHPNLFSGMIDDIPEITNRIADINRKFYDSIIHNDKFNGLY